MGYNLVIDEVYWGPSGNWVKSPKGPFLHYHDFWILSKTTLDLPLTTWDFPKFPKKALVVSDASFLMATLGRN